VRALEVWWNDRHVGQFVKDRATVTFRYDDDAPQTPISWAIPRHEKAAARAADRWLRNLLPDNPRVLARWQRTYGTADAFDLVGQVGYDVAGALVLLPEGRSPDTSEDVAQLVDEDDLAARILSLRNDPDAWQDPASHGSVRFSLAGTQGKFTAARVGSQWFWSTATLPSTHIFKPGNPRYDQLERVEAGTLRLAAAIGVPAPPAQV
jgi:serine/threonine-protein kinase HipA